MITVSTSMPNAYLCASFAVLVPNDCARARNGAGAFEVAVIRVVHRQFAVELVGERSGLHGADTFDSDSSCARRGDDVARSRRLVEPPHSARGIQTIRNALHDGGFRVGAQRADDGLGQPHTGDAPVADETFAHQRFERGNDLIAVDRHRRSESILHFGITREAIAVRE
jgi:hypothetical protein